MFIVNFLISSKAEPSQKGSAAHRCIPDTPPLGRCWAGLSPVGLSALGGILNGDVPGVAMVCEQGSEVARCYRL